MLTCTRGKEDKADAPTAANIRKAVAALVRDKGTRDTVLVALAAGVLAVAVCAAFTGLWLAAHWVPVVGVPVTVSIAVLLVAAVGVLWLAGRDERRSSSTR